MLRDTLSCAEITLKRILRCCKQCALDYKLNDLHDYEFNSQVNGRFFFLKILD